MWYLCMEKRGKKSEIEKKDIHIQLAKKMKRQTKNQTDTDIHKLVTRTSHLYTPRKESNQTLALRSSLVTLHVV